MTSRSSAAASLLLRCCLLVITDKLDISNQSLCTPLACKIVDSMYRLHKGSATCKQGRSPPPPAMLKGVVLIQGSVPLPTSCQCLHSISSAAVSSCFGAVPMHSLKQRTAQDWLKLCQVCWRKQTVTQEWSVPCIVLTPGRCSMSWCGQAETLHS